MPRTFDCPKCGAPVEFSNNPAGQPDRITCNYCNSVLCGEAGFEGLKTIGPIGRIGPILKRQ